MARLSGWTHLNRIHRAPHDSAQNWAERSNVAIGETLSTGGAVQWEYYKATDGLNRKKNQTVVSWRFKEARRRCNATTLKCRFPAPSFQIWGPGPCCLPVKTNHTS